MSLTKDDLQQLQTMMQDTVVDALEEIVIPRFERIEKRLEDHDRRFDEQDVKFREIREEMRVTNQRLDSIEGRLEALESDIKELYKMLGQPMAQSKYVKLSDSDKLLSMYADLEKLAKKMGVVLPR